MKRFFIFFACLICGNAAFTQTISYDSILQVIADKQLPFEERYKLAISTDFNGQYDLEIKAHQLLLNDVKKLPDKTYMVRLYNTITFAYIDMMDFEKAKTCSDSLLYYAENIEDTDLKAFAHYVVGNLYNSLGDFGRSHAHFYQSLDYYKIKDEKKFMYPHIYHLLAVGYYLQTDFDNFIKMIDHIIAIATEIGYPDGLVNGYSLKAAYFAEIYEKDTTLKSYQDSMFFYGKKTVAIFETMTPPIIKGTTDHASKCYISLVNCLLSYQQGDYLNQAKQYIEKAKKIIDPYDLSGTGSIRNHLAMISYLQHDYAKAKQEAFAALNIFNQNKEAFLYNEIGQAYKILSDVYVAEGNYKEAFKYEKLKNEANAKLKDEKQYTTIKELETKYEVAHKEDEIQQLKKINHYQQQIRYLYFGIIALFMLSMLILIWRFITKRRAAAAQLKVVALQKTEAELQSKLEKERAERLNAKVEEKENEYQTLLKETELRQIHNYLEGLEAERSRLSKELHDNVSNNLLSLEMQLKNQPHLEPNISMQMEQLRSQIRNISHELSPPIFFNITLPELIEDYVRFQNELTTIQLQFNFAPQTGWEDFPQPIALELYRIIQEACGNAIKYSRAEKIMIRLEKKSDCISLNINDNGQGMDVNKKHNGIGLNIIKSRAESLNGTFIIASEIGKGTNIDVKINL